MIVSINEVCTFRCGWHRTDEGIYGWLPSEYGEFSIQRIDTILWNTLFDQAGKPLLCGDKIPFGLVGFDFFPVFLSECGGKYISSEYPILKSLTDPLVKYLSIDELDKLSISYLEVRNTTWRYLYS